MIHNYLENNIQRQVKLVNLLFGQSSMSSKMISEYLKVAEYTIVSDIKYLEGELNVFIRKDRNGYFIEGNDNEKKSIIKKIYSKSLFLKFLKFFLTKTDQSYIKFIESQYISVPRGYQIKRQIISFLSQINLQIENNRVIGETFLIRFLIVELDCVFDTKILKENIHVKEITDYFFEKLDNKNESISQIDRIRFTLLVYTCLDDTDSYRSYQSSDKAKAIIDSYTYLKKIKIDIQELINMVLKEPNDNETQFLLIALAITNNRVFNTTENEYRMLKKSFLNNSYVKDLILKFNDYFNVECQNYNWFISSIYIFLKDATMDLHPISTIKYFEEVKVNRGFSKSIENIISQWNRGYIKISKKQIDLLSCRLTPLLFICKVRKIVLLSSNLIDSQIAKETLKSFDTSGADFVSIDDAKLLNQEILDSNTLLIIDNRELNKNELDEYEFCNKLFVHFPLDKQDLKQILYHIL